MFQNPSPISSSAGWKKGGGLEKGGFEEEEDEEEEEGGVGLPGWHVKGTVERSPLTPFTILALAAWQGRRRRRRVFPTAATPSSTSILGHQSSRLGEM